MLFFVSALFAQEWKTSYEEALTEARQKNKPMLLVFAGSDWCAPCIKLDKTIWQSDAFRKYAPLHYVLYKADFPRKKANRLSKSLTERNGQLAEKFNPSGHFPLVLLLDADEHVLGKTGYFKDSPEAFIELLNSFIE